MKRQSAFGGGSVAAAEVDPVAETVDGSRSVEGYDWLSVSITEVTATSYTLRLWLFSSAWGRACDESTGTLHELAITDQTSRMMLFRVSGFSRAILQVSAIAGGSIKRSMRASGGT